MSEGTEKASTKSGQGLHNGLWEQLLRQRVEASFEQTANAIMLGSRGCGKRSLLAKLDDSHLRADSDKSAAVPVAVQSMGMGPTAAATYSYDAGEEGGAVSVSVVCVHTQAAVAEAIHASMPRQNSEEGVIVAVVDVSVPSTVDEQILSLEKHIETASRQLFDSEERFQRSRAHLKERVMRDWSVTTSTSSADDALPSEVLSMNLANNVIVVASKCDTVHSVDDRDWFPIMARLRRLALRCGGWFLVSSAVAEDGEQLLRRQIALTAISAARQRYNQPVLSVLPSAEDPSSAGSRPNVINPGQDRLPALQDLLSTQISLIRTSAATESGSGPGMGGSQKAAVHSLALVDEDELLRSSVSIDAGDRDRGTANDETAWHKEVQNLYKLTQSRAQKESVLGATGTSGVSKSAAGGTASSNNSGASSAAAGQGGARPSGTQQTNAKDFFSSFLTQK